jgi:hypothetical protein
MSYKENQQILNLQVTEGLAVAVIQNQTHEFLMPVKDVAMGYDISAGTIRAHLSNNPEEFQYGKHYLKGVDIIDTLEKNAQPHAVYWTKAGVIRLGFIIKSERAKLFRDWAENVLLTVTSPLPLHSLPAAPKRRHNRLTNERLLDILVDVCQIEDSGLRNRIAAKLKGGQLS